MGVKTAEVDQFQAELIDLMNGQITFEAEDVQYVEQAVSQQIEEDSDEDDED